MTRPDAFDRRLAAQRQQTQRRKEQDVPQCPEACVKVLRDGLTRLTGERDVPIEVTISQIPPLIPSPWTQAFTCPHGSKFFMEPTGDQRAAWARKEVQP